MRRDSRARGGVAVTRVLAVDPGARGCGCALFQDKRLVRAAYVSNPCEVTADEGRAAAAGAMAAAVASWLGCYIDALAVEWPRVYATSIRRGTSHADPNDLLPLAGVDAALAALVAPNTCASYCPSEWKGQVPKDTYALRILDRLDASELAIVEAVSDSCKSKAHNVVDAVGIGLHHLGRLARRRVLA